jgi:hypothetical protein
MIGDTRQHVSQPGAGINVIEFGGGDQRVHGRRSFTATIRTGEEPGFPAKGNAAQRAFGCIIGQTDPSVVEKARECCQRFNM